jgi:hypothetical protein
MSNFQYNLDNNKQLIPNANQYILERKYVSIHSEDRDITKFPNSAEFEIELPQDYLNVQTVRLATWSFPINYDVFSRLNANVQLSFTFTKLYDPGEQLNSDPLQNAIFEALFYKQNQPIKEYITIIESGFYNPEQMATELTNKLNEAVTIYIELYFIENASSFDPDVISKFKGYKQFVVIYNSVSQKLLFGNRSSGFKITPNSVSEIAVRQVEDASCLRRNRLPDYSDWGIYPLLGFTRCPLESAEYIGPSLPRVYYGDITPGDEGFWLIPNLVNANVFVMEPPLKINFMGPAYCYMEINGMNCIDETSPYNLSSFTKHTNETNGIVNSAFAKIPLCSTPISQIFDRDMVPFKWYTPPAERIRKLKIRLRYHNGSTIEFGNFDYSFMLEFSMLTPQQERTKSITNLR